MFVFSSFSQSIHHLSSNSRWLFGSGLDGFGGNLHKLLECFGYTMIYRTRWGCNSQWGKFPHCHQRPDAPVMAIALVLRSLAAENGNVVQYFVILWRTMGTLKGDYFPGSHSRSWVLNQPTSLEQIQCSALHNFQNQQNTLANHSTRSCQPSFGADSSRLISF